MCILSREDILRKVLSKEVVFESTDPNHLVTLLQYGPNGVDWRLGPIILTADPTRFNYWFEETLEWGQTFTFEPGKHYLCSSVERLALPNNIMAMMTGRSSLGRLGWICHKTAGHFDAGWDGTATAEVMVQGDWPIELCIGDPVGQFILQYLLIPAKVGYQQRERSKYRDQQQGPIPSRLYEEKE